MPKKPPLTKLEKPKDTNSDSDLNSVDNPYKTAIYVLKHPALWGGAIIIFIVYTVLTHAHIVLPLPGGHGSVFILNNVKSQSQPIDKILPGSINAATNYQRHFKEP